MRGAWQAVVMLMACVVCHAQETHFKWEAPQAEKNLFNGDLGMLDTERDEYATHLATYAANEVTTAKASQESLRDARRLLGLALQISPRNKRAVVVAFQLSKSIMPDLPPGEYGPQAFARLLLSRGQLLGKQGGEQNQKLARWFIELAADIDPKNEDAVYASEMERLDHGPVDWAPVTDAPPKKP